MKIINIKRLFAIPIALGLSVAILIAGTQLGAVSTRADEETENYEVEESESVDIPPEQTFSDETVVLSGTLGNVTITADTKLVILSGVTQDESCDFQIQGDCTVEIAEGSENTVGTMMFVSNGEVTGGGNLEATNILSLAGDMLVFNGTGTITIPLGSIMTMYGDLYFNSGIIVCADLSDAGLAIVALKGNIHINGGSIVSEAHMNAFYAGDSIYLNGGNVYGIAEIGAAFSAGDGTNGTIEISESFETENGVHVAKVDSSIEGVQVYSLVGEDGIGANIAAGEGPEATDKIKETNSKYKVVLEEAEKAATAETVLETTTAQETEAESTTVSIQSKTGKGISKKAIIWIIVGVLVVGAVAGAAVLSVKSNKKNRKK